LFPRWLRLVLDFVGIALLLAFFGLIARHDVLLTPASAPRSLRAHGTTATISSRGRPDRISSERPRAKPAMGEWARASL
jgi:hypothetical protein